MDWRSVEDTMPKKGVKCLVWRGNGSPTYDIAEVAEDGRWTGSFSGNTAPPTHWMPLPAPPGQNIYPGPVSVVEITGGVLRLSVGEQRETVAALMQHYISGDEAVVNDKRYLVVDMKNEIIDSEVVTTFYLREPD